MMLIVTRGMLPLVLASTLFGGVALGQTPPWLLFVEDQAGSAAACDAVNAGNETLIVSATTLGLETADRVAVRSTVVQSLTPLTLVDMEGTEATIVAEVFFENLPFGLLAFAADGQGQRSLWWLEDLAGVFRVVDVVGNPPQPRVSTRSPGNFVGGVCDACDVVRDQVSCGCFDESDCDDLDPCTEDTCLASGDCTNVPVDPAMCACEGDSDCDDLNDCTDGFCLSSGECIFVNKDDAVCDDGDACTEQDACVAGLCTGVPIADCAVEPDLSLPPPVVNINICGTGTPVAITLVMSVLLVLNCTRRGVRPANRP